MRAAIYTRVSTDDGRQTVENEREELQAFCQRMGWEVAADFQDHRSGKSLDRPGFKSMIESASRREWDVLVFWDLSRLSRGGVSETLRVLEQLKSWQIAYRSLQEPYFDALGPFADVVISLLASLAKLEREKIRERTLAGLARARRQGRVGGRPKAEDSLGVVAEVRRLRADGMSIRGIALQLNMSPTTITKLVSTKAEGLG